jgi:hypothetical protein
MEYIRKVSVFWYENLKRKHNLGKISVDGRIILKRILKK